MDFPFLVFRLPCPISHYRRYCYFTGDGTNKGCEGPHPKMMVNLPFLNTDTSIHNYYSYRVHPHLPPLIPLKRCQTLSPNSNLQAREQNPNRQTRNKGSHTRPTPQAAQHQKKTKSGARVSQGSKRHGTGTEGREEKRNKQNKTERNERWDDGMNKPRKGDQRRCGICPPACPPGCLPSQGLAMAD